MRRAAAVAILVLAGCGGGGERAPQRESPGVAVPDGGMSAGHADEPRRVTVPARDRTAPAAVLRLASVVAVSGGPTPDPIALDAPVLEPTAVGRDKQGMTRIRVSLHARLRCGDSHTCQPRPGLAVSRRSRRATPSFSPCTRR